MPELNDFSVGFACQALSWSGSHRVKLGEELFYSRSRLTVTGRPHECSFTLVLTNSSTARGLNMSLFSEVNYFDQYVRKKYPTRKINSGSIVYASVHKPALIFKIFGIISSCTAYFFLWKQHSICSKVHSDFCSLLKWLFSGFLAMLCFGFF